MSPFHAIQIIAEQRIMEAQERGEFENLPGQGKPLPEEDLSHVPPELRMAYRILKNAGCVPEEVANRREISNLAEILENSPDEKSRLQAMQRLRLLLTRLGVQRHAALEARDEYYLKVLALLEKHERG